RLKSAVSIWRNVLPENVAGKVVLITGAASGIGEAPYEYGKKGAYLALVDIRDEPLFHVAALIEHYGSPEVIPMVADVSKLHDCERFIQAAVLHLGRLLIVDFYFFFLTVDHLVTNAGVAPLYLFEDIDDLSMAMPAMDINFWGSVYCTFFASSYLKKSRGKIASGCGYIASPRLSFYCASKAAVIAFYETLRIEFGSKVGVTIVAPGVVDSEMTQGKFMTKNGQFIVDKELRDMAAQQAGYEAQRRLNQQMMEMMQRMYPNEVFPDVPDP
ncbi:hypothetical protein F2Q69_00019915, partial [Brassica cretica]